MVGVMAGPTGSRLPFPEAPSGLENGQNHHYFLSETPEANFSPACRWLKVSYRMGFNRRHGRCGHLFRARFKSTLADQGALAGSGGLFASPPDFGGAEHPFGVSMPGPVTVKEHGTASNTTRMFELFANFFLRFQDRSDLGLARAGGGARRRGLEERQVGFDLPLHPLPQKVAEELAGIAEVAGDRAPGVLGLPGRQGDVHNLPPLHLGASLPSVMNNFGNRIRQGDGTLRAAVKP